MLIVKKINPTTDLSLRVGLGQGGIAEFEAASSQAPELLTLSAQLLIPPNESPLLRTAIPSQSNTIDNAGGGRLTAIPYYPWTNRGKGVMTVRFPAKMLDVDLITRSA